MTIELHSADVPQEDNLQDVRRTVQAIHDGLHDTQSIADKTQRSRRHVGYAINAAIVLGWIDGDLAVLPPGAKLLGQAVGSAEERALLKEAIEKSPSLQAIAPDLLGATAPAKAALGARIATLSGLSQSTSERRAQTLLSWRRQVLGGGA